MLVPNRNFQSPEYRYGFQGQEKDDEVKGNGNSLNYKYRMHDPRIGRFFAVDPLTKQYPHYTPYSFSGNKVIDHIELEGLEELKATDRFIEWFKPVFNVIRNSDVLYNYYNNISLESKRDKQIVYFTTYSGKEALGGRGRSYAYTVGLNSIINWTKKHQNFKTRYNKKVDNRYKKYKSLFKENGLDFNELAAEVKEGKELFIVAINLDKIGEGELELKAITIVHEIIAPDHLSDRLKGKEVKNEKDGHIKYFELDKYKSGLTKEKIDAGNSPQPDDVNPKSPAGQDMKEIKNTIEKLKKDND